MQDPTPATGAFSDFFGLNVLRIVQKNVDPMVYLNPFCLLTAFISFKVLFCGRIGYVCIKIIVHPSRGNMGYSTKFTRYFWRKIIYESRNYHCMICNPITLSHASSQSWLIGINHTNEEDNNVKYVTVSNGCWSLWVRPGCNIDLKKIHLRYSEPYRRLSFRWWRLWLFPHANLNI